MGRRKRERIEFRYYEHPEKDGVLVLTGDRWMGDYGNPERMDLRHFHNLFELGFCRHGVGHLALDEDEMAYREGAVSIIPAYYPHNTVSEGTNYWEYLFFDPEPLVLDLFPGNPLMQKEKLDVLNGRAELVSAAEQPILAATVGRLLGEYRDRRPYYHDSIYRLIQLVILELLRILEEKSADAAADYRTDPKSMAMITPVLQYVEANFAEEIRASDLGRLCGLSEVQFRRVFESAVSMPPMDYVNYIRVMKACDLMTRRDSPMEIIAQECGFNSVSSFNRNFRRFIGNSPYQWKLSQNRERKLLQNYQIAALKGWDYLESMEDHTLPEK